MGFLAVDLYEFLTYSGYWPLIRYMICKFSTIPQVALLFYKLSLLLFSLMLSHFFWGGGYISVCVQHFLLLLKTSMKKSSFFFFRQDFFYKMSFPYCQNEVWNNSCFYCFLSFLRIGLSCQPLLWIDLLRAKFVFILFIDV